MDISSMDQREDSSDPQRSYQPSGQRGPETSPQSASKSPASNTILPEEYIEIPNQQAEGPKSNKDRTYEWALAYLMSLVDNEKSAVDHNQREEIKDNFTNYFDRIPLEKIGAGVDAGSYWGSRGAEATKSELTKTLDGWWTKEVQKYENQRINNSADQSSM